MIIRTCIAVLAVASLAACGDNASQTPPASAPPAGMTGAPATAAAVALDGEGLRFAGAPVVAFGAPADEVVAAAKAAFGADPTMTQNADCPTGATEDYAWGNQLQIITRDGAFIGYHSSAAGPATSSGVHTGSTKTAAVQEQESQFEQQAITVDGVNGFLNPDKQTIGVLYAGDTCIAG